MNGIRVSWVFWVVAVLGLLWNLLGAAALWMDMAMSPDAVAQLPGAQQQIRAASPSWLYFPWAIAVAAGVLGALALLLKKRLAEPLFLVSLLALLVQVIGGYLTTPAWSLTGVPGLAFPAVLVVIALFLWRYASGAKARGWLG
ncbi:hypothetical protein CSC70_06240 [Pseudoxanthomonas kalamensis DSM 18571]|uniref:hypothetical protein n=1 Tax=Pseudoxanthomonas kalamensis TaxID=289483 RepID=UPI0013910099|nr:hypothetical protein [Pseudoxanthomonas kalamensis]KAF1711495.1 hypothetical protein CSC70_06240 [Pseudoxanthomonas kalamensis DSM 18571]